MVAWESSLKNFLGVRLITCCLAVSPWLLTRQSGFKRWPEIHQRGRAARQINRPRLLACLSGRHKWQGNTGGRHHLQHIPIHPTCQHGQWASSAVEEAPPSRLSVPLVCWWALAGNEGWWINWGVSGVLPGSGRVAAFVERVAASWHIVPSTKSDQRQLRRGLRPGVAGGGSVLGNLTRWLSRCRQVKALWWPGEGSNWVEESD